MSKKQARPHILQERPLYKGDWMDCVMVDYQDEVGNTRKWEAVHRRNRASAVVVIARMVPSGRYLIIRQFRPPVDSYVLEFPAGLQDTGETIEQAAMRELKEETGYCGRILSVSPQMFSSPGLLSEGAHLAWVEVDENQSPNQNPQTDLEETEFITVFLKHPDELPQFFEEQLAQGTFLDAKLYTFFNAYSRSLHY